MPVVDMIAQVRDILNRVAEETKRYTLVDLYVGFTIWIPKGEYPERLQRHFP